MVIVDTDVLIDLLRGRREAAELLLSLAERSSVCCSVVTVAELYAGMRQSEEDATRELVDGMMVLPLTQGIAEKAGWLKRQARGYDLELDDCFIAATAMAESVPLVTRNRKHYPFADLDVISPEY